MNTELKVYNYYYIKGEGVAKYLMYREDIQCYLFHAKSDGSFFSNDKYIKVSETNIKAINTRFKAIEYLKQQLVELELNYQDKIKDLTTQLDKDYNSKNLNLLEQIENAKKNLNDLKMFDDETIKKGKNLIKSIEEMEKAIRRGNNKDNKNEDKLQEGLRDLRRRYEQDCSKINDKIRSVNRYVEIG